MTDLPFWVGYLIILLSCLVGFLFGIYNCIKVLSIDTEVFEERVSEVEPKEGEIVLTKEKVKVMNEIAVSIQKV